MFLSELKRRNVHRMAGLYLVAAWLIVQVAETIFPLFGYDETPARVTVILLAIGFIPALIISWVFELTPEGLRRERDVDPSVSIAPETGRRMDRLISVVLALALGYFAVDKFVLEPRRAVERQAHSEAQVEAAREAGRKEALVASYGDRSIAVLPFVDMSPNQDQEYFSDGMAEELLNLLARVPQLRVISRSSAFAFKGKSIEIGEIAERLNVVHVLEGSVRKSGNAVRITAQLIDARADAHVWSQTWDRQLDDVFAVQDEIAAAVARQLEITLLGEVPRSKVVDADAYALFLQARQVARQYTPQAFEQSNELYRQALAHQPDYAAAWDGLGANYGSMVAQGLLPVAEGAPLAREAVANALTYDADYAPAHGNLGWIALVLDGDVVGATRHYQRALELAPTDTNLLRDVGELARGLGRLDLAIAIGEYVVVQDPVNPVGHANLGADYLRAGRPDRAITTLRTALQLAPDRIFAREILGEALLLKGMPEAALEQMQLESAEAWRLTGLAMAYHALGRQAESDAAIDEAVEKYEREFAHNIAYVFAYRNEPDRAFEWLAKAVVYRDPGLSEIVVEPLFNNLRLDSRWLPFLQSIGKAPEQLAAIPFTVNLPSD